MANFLTDLSTSFFTFIKQTWENIMFIKKDILLVFGMLSYEAAAAAAGPQCSGTSDSKPVDLSWHPPSKTNINDLSNVINGTGVHGFIFNSSITPATSGYGTYNWCNMPHIRSQEYVVPPKEYKLEYVELVSHSQHLSSPTSVRQAGLGAETDT